MTVEKDVKLKVIYPSQYLEIYERDIKYLLPGKLVAKILGHLLFQRNIYFVENWLVLPRNYFHYKLPKQKSYCDPHFLGRKDYNAGFSICHGQVFRVLGCDLKSCRAKSKQASN